MRSLIYAVIAALIFVGGFSLSQYPKAWADVASLPTKKPVSTDLIDWWSNGTQYQTNWSNFEQFAFQGINWIAIGFVNPTGSTGGQINWTLPNAYIGG